MKAVDLRYVHYAIGRTTDKMIVTPMKCLVVLMETIPFVAPSMVLSESGGTVRRRQRIFREDMNVVSRLGNTRDVYAMYMNERGSFFELRPIFLL